MKRQVLFILIGALFCFIPGPTLTDAADMYCPPVRVVPGGVCDCTVYNYGLNPDTGVVIEMYDDYGGSFATGPVGVQPGSSRYMSYPLPVYPYHWTTVGCKVKGAGVRSRVTLQCYVHPSTDLEDFVPSYALSVCGD